MIGSAAVGSAIAHLAFVVLMIVAAVDGRRRVVAVGAVLWVAGYVAAGHAASLAPFFMPFVALMDIVIVFIVLQRDVRLM